MKKFNLARLLLLLSVGALAGCNGQDASQTEDNTPSGEKEEAVATSIKSLSGFPQEIEQNQSLSLSGLKAVVVYSDSSEKTVDVTKVELDTSVAGEITGKAFVNELSQDFSITVKAPHVHTFSEKWTTDEISHWHAATCEHEDETSGLQAHQFGTDGICTVCEYYSEENDEELKNFTEEKLGVLSGKFYFEDYELQIDATGAKLSKDGEEKTLTNRLIKGEGFDTIATYTDSSSNLYTLTFEDAEFDANECGYMLPTLTVQNGESMQFYPSVEQFQGWYDGWDGEFSSGVSIYIVSNDFDQEMNAFKFGGANFSYNSMGDAGYLLSSFIKIEDEIKVGCSWFDADELASGSNYVDFNYYFEKDASTGKIYMNYLDGFEGWWTRPSMFGYDCYLKPSSLEMTVKEIVDYWSCDAYEFYSWDEENHKIQIGWDDPVSYEEKFDEHGAYVEAGGLKIRGGTRGIFVENNGEVEECPAYFFQQFTYTDVDFESNGKTIVFTYDYDLWAYVFTINDVVADETNFAIYNHELVLSATYGNDVYYFSPMGGSYYNPDALQVTLNGEIEMFINSSLGYQFVGTYYTMSFNSVVISDDLKATIGENEPIQGNLAYDEDLGVVLSFGEEHYMFPMSNVMFGYINDMDTDVFYNASIIDSIPDNLVSPTRTIYFDFDQMKATINGTKYDIMSMSYGMDQMYNFFPLIVLSSRNVPSFAFALVNGYVLYSLSYTGDMYFADSFLEKQTLDSMVGEYYYSGEYGIEKIKFTSDYKLFVDIINETGDGVVTQQYLEFYAFVNGSGEPYLEFPYETKDPATGEPVIVGVDIVFDGEGHCSIFVTRYLNKTFFENQGLFGSTQEAFVSVVDSEVRYNDEVVSVSSISENVVTGSVNSQDITLTFFEGTVSVVIGEEEPVVLSKNEASLEAFICDPVTNVGSLGEDIKVTEDGIFAHNIGDAEDVWYEITDWRFIIDESGNIAIKASYKAAYTYTISIVEGEVVIIGESSLPPLPPPPPPLPF